MSYEFIKYNGILKEFKIYTSRVDYEYIFDNLDEEVKYDLCLLVDYYYTYLKSQLENLDTISTIIHNERKIDEIPVYLFLYISKDYKPYINMQNSTVKIGINVTLPSTQLISPEYYNTLQNIYLLDCDLENEDDFKNYIYNTLFYGYIIARDFAFNPAFKYLNHKDDVNELLEIFKAYNRLFGEKIECSVCMEQTITKTVCNHIICQKCYVKLEKKICPMCRKVFNHGEEYQNEIYFFIE